MQIKAYVTKNCIFRHRSKVARILEGVPASSLVESTIEKHSLLVFYSLVDVLPLMCYKMDIVTFVPCCSGCNEEKSPPLFRKGLEEVLLEK